MRSIALAPALLIIASGALADGWAPIDLDRPDALHQLKEQHPQRYRAVSALLRAYGHASCQGDEIKLLEAEFNAKDIDCGLMVITTYPARRHVSFELDGIYYAATVVLADDDTVRPLTTATELPVPR